MKRRNGGRGEWKKGVKLKENSGKGDKGYRGKEGKEEKRKG